MFQAEAHVRTILFREETRWPGYFRATSSSIRRVAVLRQCKMDPVSEKWEMLKRPILPLFKSDADHELLGG
jgi:adenylylsulfate reductase subunit A